MRQLLVVLCSAMVVTGCVCGHKGTVTSEGEVLWQWPGDAGELYGPTAAITFPVTDMGSTREMTLTIQNVGAGPFTMEDFVKLTGSSTFLNPGDDLNSVFTVKWEDDAVVPPTETTTVTVTFRPPVTDDMPYADYAALTDLRPNGAESSTLSMAGRALAPDCFVPEILEFGSILLNDSRSATLSLRNVGLKTVTAKASPVTGAPPNVFTVIGFDEGGTLEVASGEAPTAEIVFHPTEVGEYVGQMTLQRTALCPERTVKYRGRGVDACITWRADPRGDPESRSLDFGPVAMREVGKGTISFFNACSFDVTLQALRTSSLQFTVRDVMVNGSTVVPAAKLDHELWLNGVVERALEFRPVALAVVTGQLRVDTSERSQAVITIDLTGTGAGPRIELDLLRLDIGIIGYGPQHVPKDSAERIVELSNTGVLWNLHLGARSTLPYWSIRTLQGAPEELCVGEWKLSNQSCLGTLPLQSYDPDAGISVSAPHGLELPVRVTPLTDGPKEWAITFYSDDPFAPQVTLQVLAQAISPPPVEVSCPAPITVDAQTPVPLIPTVTRGTASSCEWATGLRPSNSTGTFSSTTACGGSIYFADVPGVHVIDFTAHDAQGVIAQCGTEITALRTPVTAACPPAMTVAFNTTVTLPTAVTTATTAACAWSIGSRPREASGTFSAPNSCVSTTYLADEPGLHVLDFQAVDVVGTAARCRTEITVNKPPVTVSCPSAFTVDAQTSVQLPTSVMASSTTTCGWSVSARPGGSTGAFSAPASCTGTGYFADLPGVHAVTFEATDTRGTKNQCTVEITARQTPVTASCPMPMTVEANTTVTLPTTVGSATTPTCAWTVGSRPPGSIGTFSAPASCASTTYRADQPGVHVVNFRAADVVGTDATCSTTITVNKTPVTVQCPGAMNVDAQTSVSLPTTVSAATATTCGWSVDSRPAGSTGAFSAPASCALTSYFADLPGTHVVRFQATDTAGTTGQCTVEVTARRTAVTASCPIAMTVDADTTVTLPTTVGSATTPTCAWAVGSRPPGSTGTFSAPTSCASTTYRADKPGVHRVDFRVADVVGTTASCNTEITVLKTPVSVGCPAASTVTAGTTVTLPTSVSSATTPSCTWVVSSRPAGSTGTFSAPASCVSTTYRADVAGVHTVSFEATDAVGTTAQCNVEITAKAPVTASCPAPMTVFANSTVSLPTSVTSATTPTCAWSIGSRPTTSSGTFSAPTSCVTSDYFADVAGEHVLNFAVNDTLGSQATCSTAITVKPKGGLWVELTWDKDNDIDLHVAHPNASAWFNNPWDCYYSNKNPTWSAIVDANPHLDRDDTNFKGPENTRINVPETGLKYSIGVHFFASRSGSTVSTVRVYCDGALVTTRTRSITTVNSMWAVGTVEFSATSPCQFRAVDTVMPNAKLVIDAKE